MKEEGKYYCDTSKVSIAPISKNVAKKIIVEKHYTHAWTSCRYSLGIFYDSHEQDVFGNTEKLIGCAIYGFPVGAKAATSISDKLTKDNVLELTRLYIDDGYGSNIESYSMAQTFKWFKENDKNIKCLISYADNGQEHLGKIYQATNWIYQGTSEDIQLMPNYRISLTNDPYDWIHSRSVYNLWGSSNLEHLRREIGKQGYEKFWRKMEDPKHRYLQFISQNKKEKKELIKSMKHPPKPYPKELVGFQKEIVEHATIPPEESNEINFW